MEKPTSRLLDELNEAVDVLYKNHPPRIELRGWWWKKYINHFRRQRDAMQAIIDDEWNTNLAEKVSQEMEQIIKRESKEYIKNFFRP